MSTPPKSLSARVPWLWLLGQLEVVVPSPVLPAIFLRCPLCGHAQLTIMEDYLTGGQWFYCRNCDESGDMIELAAKAWGLSIAGTIIKLARRGFDLPTDCRHRPWLSDRACRIPRATSPTMAGSPSRTCVTIERCSARCYPS